MDVVSHQFVPVNEKCSYKFIASYAFTIINKNNLIKDFNNLIQKIKEIGNHDNETLVQLYCYNYTLTAHEACLLQTELVKHNLNPNCKSRMCLDINPSKKLIKENFFTLQKSNQPVYTETLVKLILTLVDEENEYDHILLICKNFNTLKQLFKAY